MTAAELARSNDKLSVLVDSLKSQIKHVRKFVSHPHAAVEGLMDCLHEAGIMQKTIDETRNRYEQDLLKVVKELEEQEDDEAIFGRVHPVGA